MNTNELFDSITEAVAAAWGMLLSKSLSFGMARASELGTETLSAGNCVRADIDFSGDVAGKAAFWLPQTEALTIVGMMLSMGMDDELVKSTREKEEVGPEELDAVKEAMSQLAATAGTVLRDKLGVKVSSNLGAVAVDFLAGAPDGFSDNDTLFQVALELEGFDAAEMVAVFDSKLVSSMSAGKAAPAASSSSASPSSAGSSSSDSSPAHQAPEVDLERIKALRVQVNAILAERTMDVRNILDICVGSVVEFPKEFNMPVELHLGSNVLAHGETVVTKNGKFAIRVLELAPAKVEG